MLFLKADDVVNLLPLPPALSQMFTGAAASASFVRTIAFGDGRMLVGSASAYAKLQMCCIWRIRLVSLQRKTRALHHSFLSLCILGLCFLLVCSYRFDSYHFDCKTID